MRNVRTLVASVVLTMPILCVLLLVSSSSILLREEKSRRLLGLARYKTRLRRGENVVEEQHSDMSLYHRPLVDPKTVQLKARAAVATTRQRFQVNPLELVHITKTGGTALEIAAQKQGILWGRCHYWVSYTV
jgi:hypothetical protein